MTRAAACAHFAALPLVRSFAGANCAATLRFALSRSSSAHSRIPAFIYAITPATRKERNGKPYPDDYRIVCATGARYWGLPNAFGALKPVKENRRWFTLDRLGTPTGNGAKDL